ncbi:MAG: membrane protein insertion efficiency factor YidD [Candidatus Dojkabacteria bacterium]|nr:MAG: membrane protein insertion efficiency factor YidD [Candidatus Dojkabacteria bacterium]
MKYLLMGLIKLYQATLSFDHGFTGKLFPNTRYCRYTPSCSQYGYEAIERFGAVRGGWLAIKRVGSCHEWSTRPHYDPVPEKL